MQRSMHAIAFLGLICVTGLPGCDQRRDPSLPSASGLTAETTIPSPESHPVSGNAPKEATASQADSSERRLQPDDITYLGAFRLPEASGGSSWEYSTGAMTYFPEGDPAGPDDGFLGSIFAVGHDHHQMISEITIPAPVRSETAQIEDLPVASTLQPFSDIRGDRFGELEIPRAGLEYLPANDDSQSGKLHFCWGQHFQFERDPSHGWSRPALTSPDTQGPWVLADYTNYVSNDYLFEIPVDWANEHLPGYRLVTGRFRDGQWGGLGPALLAYAPPDAQSPPDVGARLTDVRTLLMYGRPQANAAELEISDDWKMDGFSESDEWSGGAWLTREDLQAVVLVGTKAIGKTWYGFANGVIYPISGDPNDPIPEVPPFPFDARGWWSEDIAAQIMFFDPNELLEVVQGRQDTWAPQPYATLSIDRYLFDAGYDHPRQKRYLLGACCFDRARGVLYVAERQVKQDEDKSIIHAFQID